MSEEKKPIVVGTYNMSFASDKGWMPKRPSGKGTFPKDSVPPPVAPSEAAFLRSLDNDKDRREFWKNALKHLKEFIVKKQPLAVGLQEMNLTTEQDKHKGADGEQYGTYVVEQMLKGIGEDKYKIISRDVSMNNAGISLILNIEEAGDEKKTKIYDNLNQANGPAPPGGRPILMHLTNKNYLFISMHGAQDGQLGKYKKQFNEYMVENNKKELEKKVKDFLGEDKPDAIYVMGDFNDRYDAITEFDFGIDTIVKYDGESPASCCYNYNSMSKSKDNDERIKIYAEKLDNEDHQVKVETYQGKEEKDTDPAMTNEKGIIQKAHGINIEHYLNKGDKVFAWPYFGKLEIYTGSDSEHLSNPSDKSDHELVFMTITPIDPEKVKQNRNRREIEPKKPEYVDPRKRLAESADTTAESAATTTTDISAEDTKTPTAESADTTAQTTNISTEDTKTQTKETEQSLFGGFFGGKKKTKKRKSSKKKTKKKRKGKRKGGTKKLNTTHKK